MPIYDLPMVKLQRYAPRWEEPNDIDQLWAAKLADTRAHSLEPRFEDTTGPLRTVRLAQAQFLEEVLNKRAQRKTNRGAPA